MSFDIRSSDDGSSNDEGPDDRLVPSSLQQACNDWGHVEPCNDLQLDLDPETVLALSQMQQVSDPSHWPGIKGLAKGWPTKLCIHREVGRQSVYVPVTTKTFRNNELVGCVAGTLMERDAAWHLKDKRHNNAKPWLAVSHHPTARTASNAPLPIPLIAVYSSRRIAKGLELRMDWGEVMWERYHQIKVIKQGGANHQLHLKLQRLDQLLQTAESKIPWAKRHSKRMRLEDADPSGPAESDRYMGFNPDINKWYWEQPGSTDGSDPNDAVNHEEDSSDADADADDSSRSEAGTSSAAAELQQGFRVLSEQEVASVFPGLRHTNDFNQLPEAVLDLFDEFDAEQLSAGLAVQSLPATKVQVAEVVDLQHPVRWCTAPHERAYTLVASADIAKDEPIIDYVGCYKAGAADVKRPLDAAYSYGIDKRDLQQLGFKSSSASWRRQLFVDNKRVGNISRFINCCWGRMEPAEGAPPHVNVGARVVWNTDISRPIVRLFADRPISKGEELVVDYGPHYWSIVARALMIAQHEYAAKALALEERLVRELQLCEQRGLLTREELHAAQTCAPNVHKVQFYKGPGSM
eukprot:gene12718-12848_t